MGVKIGFHGPNAVWTNADWNKVEVGSLKALVLMDYHTAADHETALECGVDTRVVRIGNPYKGIWFTDDMSNAVLRQFYTVPYSADVYYQLGNEPNVESSFTPSTWQVFTKSVRNLVKSASFRLSPAPISPGTPDADDWLKAWADTEADWRSVHAYWQDDPREALDWVVRVLDITKAGGPNVPIIITEFNCAKGFNVDQYVAFWKQLAALPQVIAACPFILGGTPEWSKYWPTLGDMSKISFLGGYVEGQPEQQHIGFELPRPPSLDQTHKDLMVYAEWALERVYNSQDPRDQKAFTQYLHDTYRDYEDLPRWGWPTAA